MGVAHENAACNATTSEKIGPLLKIQDKPPNQGVLEIMTKIRTLLIHMRDINNLSFIVGQQIGLVKSSGVLENLEMAARVLGPSPGNMTVNSIWR
jgi:hypothetical protein